MPASMAYIQTSTGLVAASCRMSSDGSIKLVTNSNSASFHGNNLASNDVKSANVHQSNLQQVTTSITDNGTIDTLPSLNQQTRSRIDNNVTPSILYHESQCSENALHPMSNIIGNTSSFAKNQIDSMFRSSLLIEIPNSEGKKNSSHRVNNLEEIIPMKLMNGRYNPTDGKLIRRNEDNDDAKQVNIPSNSVNYRYS